MWVIVLEKVKQSVKIRKLHHLTVIQPLKQGEDNNIIQKLNTNTITVKVFIYCPALLTIFWG